MFLSTVDNQYLVGASSPSGHSISSVSSGRSAARLIGAVRTWTRGKARAQNFVRAFAPCDRPPGMFRQRQRQTLGADPRPQLAPAQNRLHLNCWNDSNDIAEPQFARPGAQFGVGTVARIVQHDTARYAGRASSAELIECNLRLGLEFDLLGNTRLLAALGILGPFLRQIELIGDRQAGMFIGNR